MASVGAKIGPGYQAASRAVRVPAGMLAASVGLWGWSYDAIAYALVSAIAVEAARFVPVRLEIDDRDFHRIADLSAVALLLLGIVQFSDRGLAGIYGVLEWFPLAVLGLLLAQLYSTRDAVELSALFLSVRIALRRGRITDPGRLDMRLPFLFACLLSATASPGRGAWLIAAAGAIVLWLLMSNRPRPRPRPSVAAALLLCAAVAAAALAGITSARRALEPIIMDIVRERIAHWRDPFRSYTAIGEVGRLKLSDRIVMRVSAPPGVPVPRLLHEASYSQFSRNTWLAPDTRFRDLTPGADGTRWDLAPGRAPFRLVTISRGLIRNRGMLSLPAGAFRIDDLPVEELKASRLGALKVLNGPALVRYQARYAPGTGLETAPGEEDLSVPPDLEPLLLDTLRALEIASGDAALVRRIAGFFARGFDYSLTLRRPAEELHPVADFLTRTRRGHCEYFATATVLLLRAAGIPARYASGYSVQEWSPLEEAFVVRRRHAHTWARAFVDGHWVDVDTTPASWIASDAAAAAWWQSIYDLLSFAWHAWSSWRLGRIGEESDTRWLLLALIPLVTVLVVRIRRSRRVRRSARSERRRRGAQTGSHAPQPSAFARVERRLSAGGIERPPSLPLGRWLERLRLEGRLPDAETLCGSALRLHYRARFHPGGISPSEQRALEAEVDAWLRGPGRGLEVRASEPPSGET